MDEFQLDELLISHDFSTKPYQEFLRVPSLSVGVYQLPKGGVDLQGPHVEDEVYYVVSGKAKIQVRDEHRPVGPGSIVYVAARIPHRFYDIEEMLTVLVFFAPPESAS